MTDWRNQAACIGADTNLFFPGKGGHGERAHQLCRACPVAAECLAFAFRMDRLEGEEHGIYGGVGPRARRALRRSAA